MAECRNHEGSEAAALCSRCGDFVCALCAIRVEGVDYCPTCVLKERGDAVTFGPYIPWENRKRLGILRAAWETNVAMFTRPREFYERMPMEGGFSEPLLYGMLMRSVVVIVLAVVIAGFYLIVGAATREPIFLMQAGFQIGGIFINIPQSAIFLFMLAGLLHLGVLVIAGGLGFERTFRVYSYSRGADLLDLIPGLGWIVSTALCVFFYFLGLRNAHKLDNGRALGIAAMPLMLWFGFVVFAIGFAVLLVLLVGANG